MNDLDDELRAALGAAGGPAPARPPFDDVRRRARVRQRRQRALVGAGMAAVVVAAGTLAWTLAVDGSDPDDVIVDQPTTLGPTTTTAPTSTTTTVTAPAIHVPAPGARPSELVAVDEHGRLVVVDAASGAVIRQLDAEGDPTVPIPPEQEMGPNVLDDVAVAPGGIVYYTSVGEPAGGSVLRRAIDGTPPPDDLAWLPGNEVAIRADGAEVATVHGAGLSVYGADGDGHTTGPPRTPLLEPPADVLLGAVSWSLDGSVIAVEWLEVGDGGGADSVRVALVPAGGATGGPRLAGPADPAARAYSEPAFRRDGAVVVAEQDRCEPSRFRSGCENAIGRVLDPATGEVLASFGYGTDSGAVVDQSYDATGTWLLVTFEDGTLRWYGGGEGGLVPGSYRAADW